MAIPFDISRQGAAQATADFEDELRRRQKFKASLADVTKTSRENVGLLQKGQAAGKSAIRNQSAQALAASTGQTGAIASGGGAAASIRQAALSRGGQEAGFEASTTQGIAEAKTRASQTALEEQIALQEIGSLSGQRLEKISNATAQLDKIREDTEGGIFSIGEDPENFLGKVRALLVAEGDPIVKAIIRRRAVEIFEEEFGEELGQQLPGGEQTVDTELGGEDPFLFTSI